MLILFYVFFFNHLVLYEFAHLFILGYVVFSVDFIGGLDAHSYYQDHVELKPVHL